MAPKQDPKPKFQEGERVLCFHGPLLYEAKCVKVAIKDKQVKYFIHYSGWNKKSAVRPRRSEKTLKTREDIVALFPVPEGAPSVHHPLLTSSWDEWVPESRVLKYVDTNLQKQRELQKANQEQYAEGKMRGAAPGKKTSGLQQKNVEVKTKKNKQKTPGNGDGGSTSETPQPPRKKRARVDPTVENEETFMNRVEVKVKIPEELKPWLVDDWDLITRQKQLFYLPAKKNVDSILEDYANYKKSRGNTDNKEYAVNEVVAGIKEYFNVMLGTQLLYKFERPQYAEILADHPDAPMSQVYGAPHLLRLFVRIGAMLAYTPLDEKSLALLLNYLHDFLKYLAKNSATLFSASDYEVAPPEYHRKAVCLSRSECVPARLTGAFDNLTGAKGLGRGPAEKLGPHSYTLGIWEPAETKPGFMVVPLSLPSGPLVPHDALG
ncbi:mortality factor 4-like protein 1 isoform X2 [Rhinolophus ferrumequinum]|uniref:mortality factor 4-like protein 1 isoform X2 n=1 Tax=Rhinolophus ferrumequinum TaxID=59479 RepID=UPI00140F8589|nr:mortality factor 4-like protein 1 isoform X2 [Rhinolophus ferrumequinum]